MSEKKLPGLIQLEGADAAVVVLELRWKGRQRLDKSTESNPGRSINTSSGGHHVEMLD